MNCLAIIPARGGSKGIPHKNLAECGGKPLVQWTIDAVLHSKLVNYAVLSSDEESILAIVPDGCKIEAQRRPVELAEDWTPTEAVITHVLSRLEFEPDIIVLLQPTSPIRTGQQIDEAISMLIATKEDGYYTPDSVVSVVRNHSFLWYKDDKGVSATYDWTSRKRRQEISPQFEENGSIYAFTKRMWDSTHNRLGGAIGFYVMPEESRIQVDTPLDLAIVDFLLRRQHG